MVGETGVRWDNFHILLLFSPGQDKQALTKAYSLHDLRAVGIANKNEFNTAKMAQCALF